MLEQSKTFTATQAFIEASMRDALETGIYVLPPYGNLPDGVHHYAGAYTIRKYVRAVFKELGRRVILADGGQHNYRSGPQFFVNVNIPNLKRNLPLVQVYQLLPEEQGWRRGADHRYVTHKASDNSVYLRQTPALFRLQFNGVEGERAYKIWRERNIRNEECRKALGLPCG